VQVGADGSALGANQNALAAFLNTEAGRGLLSVSGEPSDIRVQKADMRSGGVTVQFWDQGAPAIVGAQKQEWRGFFDLNGRLTTIAVRGRAAAPLGTDEGQVLLDRAMAAMQQANPDVSG